MHFIWENSPEKSCTPFTDTLVKFRPPSPTLVPGWDYIKILVFFPSPWPQGRLSSSWGPSPHWRGPRSLSLGQAKLPVTLKCSLEKRYFQSCHFRPPGKGSVTGRTGSSCGRGQASAFLLPLSLLNYNLRGTTVTWQVHVRVKDSVGKQLSYGLNFNAGK